LLHLESPVLNEVELEQIHQSDFETANLVDPVPHQLAPRGLAQAVEALCDRADAAVKAGQKILVLSDRTDAQGNPA
jgi:glutamate synthase (ferredoxin)